MARLTKRDRLMLEGYTTRIDDLKNDVLYYGDDLAYAKQAPYGNSSDTLEAVEELTGLLEEAQEMLEAEKEEKEDFEVFCGIRK